MNNTDKNKRIKIQALERAIAILDFLAANSEGESLTNICRSLGLNKSTAFGLVSSLEELQCVQQDQDTGKYFLGLKLFGYGQVVCSNMSIPKIAAPYLRELMEKYEETTHLAILFDADVMYLDKVEGPRTMRVATNIGMRFPAYSTGIGKVLLAGLTDRELDKLLKNIHFHQFTPNTITDIEVLKRALKTIREKGYSIDDEESEIGLKCVAAPIKNYSGSVVAAISLSGPPSRMPDDITCKIADDLISATRMISAQLGYKAERFFSTPNLS